MPQGLGWNYSGVCNQDPWLTKISGKIPEAAISADLRRYSSSVTGKITSASGNFDKT